jgi:hypothetical protein
VRVPGDVVLSCDGGPGAGGPGGFLYWRYWWLLVLAVRGPDCPFGSGTGGLSFLFISSMSSSVDRLKQKNLHST